MKGKSAQRYAQALVNLTKHSTIRKELEGFSKLLKNSSDLFDVLSKDIFTLEEKRKVLEKLVEYLAFSSTTKNFFFYLAQRNRFAVFFDIQRELEEKLNELEKKSHAEIFSPIELSDAFKKKLREKFEKILGKKIDVSYKMDSSLLGGIVMKIGNHVFDGSLRTQLYALGDQLAVC